jgi:hypothetical protein
LGELRVYGALAITTSHLSVKSGNTMKKVENKEQLIAVIFKNRLTLTERFGVSDIAVFGSYA